MPGSKGVSVPTKRSCNDTTNPRAAKPAAAGGHDTNAVAESPSAGYVRTTVGLGIGGSRGDTTGGEAGERGPSPAPVTTDTRYS